MKVSGEWIEQAHVVESSIKANYTGWEPTLGFDKYLTLLMVRVNYNISGNIVASVKCTDDCGNKEWVDSYNSNASSDEYIDLGLNIPATALGIVTRNPLIGAIANAVVIDLKINEALQGLGNKIGQKAGIINALGPDYICEFGWPQL